MPNTLPAWLDIARGLLKQPTAAIRETLPQTYVRQFVADRPNLKLSEDAAGNLRVDYRAVDATRPPLVMVAHLDHPGFHITSIHDNSVDMSFQGSVNGRHAIPGSRVQFFEIKNPNAIGEGALVSRSNENGALKTATARLESGRATLDGFAMWAFPGFSIENDFIVTRCCDDLLGAAAALCALDEISKSAPSGVALTGFFTRAEELGFLGTLEAIRLETLPKNACILSLECSKALANAPQGAGVIVRVGDASSIFDTDLTHALTLSAQKRAERDATFKFQRKLMDGGTCEATPFCAHGYRASGLALPLGNYHNQAFDTAGNPCMGPESVHVEDFRCEIELLVELALHPEWLDDQHDQVTPRLKANAAMARKLLS
ncbi:MAG: hypothetical protein WCT04_13705 [Planctomycetota bacterium]